MYFFLISIKKSNKMQFLYDQNENFGIFFKTFIMFQFYPYGDSYNNLLSRIQ